jgi:hypothetical protein
MEVLGLLFFKNEDAEEIIFYDDNRDDLIRFKTQVDSRTYEYIFDTKDKTYYRCTLTEDYYGDPVYEYRLEENISHLYLIEKELLL